jgi:hypothetical protein
MRRLARCFGWFTAATLGLLMMAGDAHAIIGRGASRRTARRTVRRHTYLISAATLDTVVVETPTGAPPGPRPPVPTAHAITPA